MFRSRKSAGLRLWRMVNSKSSTSSGPVRIITSAISIRERSSTLSRASRRRSWISASAAMDSSTSAMWSLNIFARVATTPISRSSLPKALLRTIAVRIVVPTAARNADPTVTPIVTPIAMVAARAAKTTSMKTVHVSAAAVLLAAAEVAPAAEAVRGPALVRGSSRRSRRSSAAATKSWCRSSRKASAPRGRPCRRTSASRAVTWC